MSIKKLLYAATIVLLLASSGTALRFYSLDTGRSTYEPGETVRISAQLVNGEQPRADHQIEFAIAYSPIYNKNRAMDGETIQVQRHIPIEFTPGETRYLNHTWQLSDNAAPGSYKIYYFVRDANENTVVVNTARFNVSYAGQEIRAILMDDLLFHQGNSIGYSLEGLRVTPNKTANTTMMVTNVGNVELDITMTMDMQYSFDRTQSAFNMTEQVTIAPNQTEKVVFEFMPPDEPTSYTPVFTAYDSQGTFLGQTHGRLVVRGNSGRILNAGIGKLGYAGGQPITLTAELIGPADYSGTIQDATLNYTVEDSQGVLIQGERTVDIGGQITDVKIQEEAPRAFANPNVTMVLHKNGNVYDRYHVSYTGGEVPETGLDLRIIAGIVVLVLAAGLLVWRWRS
ncbi:MAG: hypothetical protein SV186_06750 [Candidatus Nanohaloarchaea archaeon]|nr:hypothetical protein [Candidatus Nanohaloarchaea archaeon]